MTLPSSRDRLEALRRAAHALHERYQHEIVEGLNICPFARKSRELGRVHRPIYLPAHEDATPPTVATRLRDQVEAAPDAEIVLLTFVVGPDHPFAAAAKFEGYLKELRAAWDALPAPAPWYMVSFHPRPVVDPERPTTRDSLVPLLRRTPDPLIQCVNAQVLDRVRREAQRVSHERMMQELKAKSPELAELFARSVQADPELGADIAQHNFEHHGVGEGREKFERRLRELFEERKRVYAQFPEFDLC